MARSRRARPAVRGRDVRPRFPSPTELLRYETLASPLAEPLAQLDPSDHDALIADVEETLTAYVDDDGLAIPMEAHIVLAA